jgi:two-component system, OmpR family, osmolarity sensor histidine kinase EnvZ
MSKDIMSKDMMPASLMSVFDWLTPKGLYTRTMIIVIAPVVILQSILVFVFMEQHWGRVTRALSTATVRHLALLAAAYESGPRDAASAARLAGLARQKLSMQVQFLPNQDFPAARPRPLFAALDETLAREIKKQIGKPFWVDTAAGGGGQVEIRLQLNGATLQAQLSRSQTAASNSHIFVVWMAGSSLFFLSVAVLFLRSQISPIQVLAQAAEGFGMGRSIPKDFRVRGALEVQQAAVAFIKMRNRIERHVEQRTTMLAGVSHDLRTVLTRFRLQLAMLGDSPGIKALDADVDEMLAMLEDYLAFAKGGSGEPTSSVDVRQMLEDVQKHVARTSGVAVTLDWRSSLPHAAMRGDSFRRAVLNIAGNAARFGQRVEIRAENEDNFLVITIEDNGPGIPEGLREKVFKPFFRLDDARNQNVANTGLGLAIARDIMRAHGGDITLSESALGGVRAVMRAPV